MMSLIVAIGKNGEIGKNNKMLWHIPEELKLFKRTTLNHRIVMGRNTWESLGFKPLPGRETIIVSKTLEPNKLDENCYVVNSLDDVVKLSKSNKGNDELFKTTFIIGGAQLYNAVLDLDLVEKMYITTVDGEFPDANVFFPIEKINFNKWELFSEKRYKEGFTFRIYRRKGDISYG